MRRTVQAALDEAAAAIGRTEARILACAALERDRAWLAAHPLELLGETQDARLDLFVSQRELGVPVAYIVGIREFYGREFEVTPDVLIPRPETETLVEAALPLLAAGSRALDLGTGCGAIAVTLAAERPGVQVTATDISEEALTIARSNAARHGCRITFALGDWYAPVESGRFDLIVSNPPYVAAADPHLQEGDLRFEPSAALTDGSRDGLESARKIVSGAAGHLNSGGWFLIEHGYDQAEACRTLLLDSGLVDTLSLPDLAGIPRVAGGRWP